MNDWLVVRRWKTQQVLLWNKHSCFEESKKKRVKNRLYLRDGLKTKNWRRSSPSSNNIREEERCLGGFPSPHMGGVSQISRFRRLRRRPRIPLRSSLPAPRTQHPHAHMPSHAPHPDTPLSAGGDESPGSDVVSGEQCFCFPALTASWDLISGDAAFCRVIIQFVSIPTLS